MGLFVYNFQIVSVGHVTASQISLILYHIVLDTYHNTKRKDLNIQLFVICKYRVSLLLHSNRSRAVATRKLLASCPEF